MQQVLINIISSRFLTLINWLSLPNFIPYSRKYLRQLDLAVEPQITIAKILVDLNLVVARQTTKLPNLIPRQIFRLYSTFVYILNVSMFSYTEHSDHRYRISSKIQHENNNLARGWPNVLRLLFIIPSACTFYSHLYIYA